MQSQERIQVNITVPKWLKDAMDGLYFARWKTDGSETHKCKFYVEALTPYVSSMDPNTGYPKRPASTSEVRMEGVAAETAIVLPSNLQHFSALVNCNQYEDDDSICAAADQFWEKVWLTKADHKCFHVNPNLAHFTGRSLADMLGWGWTDLIHPEERDACVANCVNSCHAQRQFWNMYRMKNCRGAWEYVVDCGVPRYRPGGRFAGFVGTVFPIPAPGSPVELVSFEDGRWVRSRATVLSKKN